MNDLLIDEGVENTLLVLETLPFDIRRFELCCLGDMADPN